MVRGNNNHTCSPSFSNASSRPACKWSPPPLSASVGNAIPRISSTGTGELAHETLEAVRELFGQWEDGKSDAERADGVRVAARKCNSSARASALDSRVFISLVQSSASPHLLTGRHIQVSGSTRSSGHPRVVLVLDTPLSPAQSLTARCVKSSFSGPNPSSQSSDTNHRGLSP